ncbi:Receptor-like cytosolic serine/threonine-protein kinase [Nymphaea thermarum]|nr:Receptor-like cytosolic serine/threonine-protein kinase [Nymphaea thermarum]
MKLSDHFSNQSSAQAIAGAIEEKADDGTSKELNPDVTNDEGSPRAVLEGSVLALCSDSSSSSSIGSSSSPSSVEKPNSVDGSQWRTLLQILKVKSIRRLSTFPPIGHSGLGKKSTRRLVARPCSFEEDDAGLFRGFPTSKPLWRSFGYDELACATDYFSAERLIGKGGHAVVYRGHLPDGELVAIKKLTKGKTEEDRIGDFLSELGIIAHINHPNAARLIGFGVEGGLHLVLQFSPHGSLASVLHGSKAKLEWEVRYKVALGTAEGLRYLHGGCPRRIVHRDIKASNILLTEDYQPQVCLCSLPCSSISDFGLAKWLPDQWTHHIVSPVEGTFGYLAPEYFMHGIVDEKIDVFAFGVLLLELITGRRAVDSCRQSLLMWAKPLIESKNVKELVDPSLQDNYDHCEMNWVMLTASLCVHHLAAARPTMSQVVRLLKGESAVIEATGKEQLRTQGGGGGLQLLDALDVEEYTTSRYLNDLNRHRQLALEF